MQPRASTGIGGLDYILGGGLPANHFYLLAGNPGTGKTTAGLQFLLEGQRRGEKVLYVTLSETKVELEAVANAHGWSLDGIGVYELETIEDTLNSDAQYTVFHPSEVELNETTKRIVEQIEAIQPTRVVFDSLSEMRLMARDPLRYRRQILSLKQYFVGRQCTVILLDDNTGAANDIQLQSISHGVIQLERQSLEYGAARRRLQVIKMRGLKYREGYHDFTIKSGGLVVYPRLVAADNRPSRDGHEREKVKSGLAGLDALLGGGMHRGTSTLVMGPAGCGKSTLITQYALAAAQRGEHVACYAFEETRENFLERAAGLGMDVRDKLDSGLMTVEQVDPAEMSPGEFAARVVSAVKDRHAGMVVIDSLNGYINAMPSESFLLIQMHELLTFLNERNVVTLIVMAQHGVTGTAMESPIDITYLADSVIVLRYFEAAGEVKQAIAVIKKRTGAHERHIRELRLNGSGIQVGEPLTGFHGILTGVPIFQGKSEELLGKFSPHARP